MANIITKPEKPWTAVPAGVWALGLVSLLMDFSSEMIHALLPVYLVGAFHASGLIVGVIEGVAEAVALIVRIFSGALSDWLGKRKILAAFGYGIAAFTKPVFPLAPTVGWLFAARFIDRIGKGVRGAPRDALVADFSPPDALGASFGLRQSLDTIGAVAGPLLAIALMTLSGDNFTLVFWVAVIPGFLSFLVIAFAVKEPERPAHLRKVKNPISRSELRLLGAPFWRLTAIGSTLTLARFSEAFLMLKASAAGLPIALAPAVLVAMSAVFALSAYPAGVLSDRMDRRSILAAGVGVLIAADLALAFAPGLSGVALGVMLWGLHMGLTQGLLAALIAETACPELRGTAFGIFNLACGVATLVASVIAGALWDVSGPEGAFIGGAVFSMLALFGLLAVRGQEKQSADRAWFKG